jgi:hypothetical protein
VQKLKLNEAIDKRGRLRTEALEQEKPQKVEPSSADHAKALAQHGLRPRIHGQKKPRQDIARWA